MSDPAEIWTIIPVKETRDAKQRLAPVLSAALRQALALAMLEDVLDAVAGVAGLGGVILVTVDPQAKTLARRYGLEVLGDGAQEGHTGAVNAGVRRLIAQGRRAMGELDRLLDSPMRDAPGLRARLARGVARASARRRSAARS